MVIVGLVLHMPCVLWTADSAMVIVAPGDSPFAGVRMRSVPYNKHLGSQGTDPVLVNVTGEIMALHSGSVCGTVSDIPDEVRGRVVLVASIPLVGCPVSWTFNLLQQKGATAWIVMRPPGFDASDPFNFYSRNRYQPDPSANNLLFVAVEEPDQFGASLTKYLVDRAQHERIVVSIQPDRSNWDGFYPRWYVQLPLRWIPAIIFGATSLLAVVFLRKHLQNFEADYVRQFPRATMQTRQRFWKFVGKQFSIVHLILVIELMATFVMCAFIGVGGWQSNALVPFEMTEFFITALSGWGFACDVLSAILWSNVVKRTPGAGRDSWFGQFLERNPLVKVTLCVLPVLLDTGASLCAAFYVQIPLINLFTALLIMLMQLTVGIQFLVQALTFQKHAWQSVQGNVDAVFQMDDRMDHLLQRLNRWTLGLSMSMIAFVCFVPIAATTFLYSQVGWVLFWSGAGTARALTSLCRVMLAQPRPPRGSAHDRPLQISTADQ